MQLRLTKKVDHPTIIVGFPGIGLVGPIVTEFLIDHMKTERIGTFEYNELPPMVPIHKGALVHPMAVHYSEKYNTIIVYTILNLKQSEWAIAKTIAELAKECNAKEILCIDGANTVGDEKETIFGFGNERLLALGAKPMTESVIIGVSAALLISAPSTSCVFAATQQELPDSKAAATVVQFLDKYLGLEVDYQPLLAQAAEFEQKLKTVMTQTQQAFDAKERKSMDYLG